MSEAFDIHVHVFPPRMFDAVWRWFDGVDWDVHRQYADHVAATLEDHGVGRAVALNYAHKPGVARSLNAFNADLAVEHPIFMPFASLHVDDDDLEGLVAGVLKTPGLHGFKFQPLVQAYDLNDPRLDVVYQACLEAGFPLLIHAGTAPLATPHVGLAHFDRLMNRFPELRVCVAHMGAFEMEGFLSRLDRFPNVVLDTAMIQVETDVFDTTWRGDPATLRRHADRVCFGSDWPNVPYGYDQALASVRRFPLDDEAVERVLGANARRFLRVA